MDNPTDDSRLLKETLGRLDVIRRWLQLGVPTPPQRSPATIAHLRVLNVLHLYGPQTMSELANQLGVSKAACTELVSTLRGRGWVTRTRSARDRRRVYVDLTIETRHLGSTLDFARRRVLGTVLDKLSPNERQVFLKGLLTLIDTAEGEMGLARLQGLKAKQAATPRVAQYRARRLGER